ncbi:hypothetical protein [uncultured Chryseobacterium sp.]|uniref:hypothetical protein n=1 Tax=uncultured Chryseobacterium sp. TaxID=259322 RepID=UPI0025DF9D31|nr:hypothetical protein [uncultured Chryseobacterium sp.]
MPEREWNAAEWKAYNSKCRKTARNSESKELNDTMIDAYRYSVPHEGTHLHIY